MPPLMSRVNKDTLALGRPTHADDAAVKREARAVFIAASIPGILAGAAPAFVLAALRPKIGLPLACIWTLVWTKHSLAFRKDGT